jgi:hypothetical protein
MIKKISHLPTRPLLTGTALVGMALNSLAGSDQPAVSTASGASQDAGSSSVLTTQFQKPAWLTDLSAGVKESYDDNVLLVSGNGPMKAQSSFVTSASAKLGVNFAPLLGDQSILQTLSLGYAPELNVYHNAPDETYSAHRFTNALKGKTGDLSFSLDSATAFINGSDTAPIYEGDDKYRNGFASLVPKERREQLQERAKAVIQYDLGSFFFRPTASLLYYDMMTALKSTAGYQNYPSRADVNGGIDFGYRLTKNLAVTLGYRYGHQYQQQMSEAIDSNQFASGSDYQRVLLGLEGKPWHWLTISLQGGPDFRLYDSTAAVTDHHDITYYGEASATAEITSKDSLSLKYKQWRFVSYTGRIPYFDSNYELTYHRKLTDQLSFDLTGRIASFDFTCATDPKESNQRNDYFYSINPGLTFAFTKNFSVTASGSIEFARSVQDNPPGGSEYREFDHNVASLAANYKF